MYLGCILERENFSGEEVMDRLTTSLHRAIAAAGWLSVIVGVFTPAWFALAALGTKWGLWDWSIGLNVLTLEWGPRLVWLCLGAGIVSLLVILAHRLVAHQLEGNFLAPALALTVGLVGSFLFWQDGTKREAVAVVLDITTDASEPPHFTAGFVSRRSAADLSLEYAGKTGVDGRVLSEMQQEAWPNLTTLHLGDEPAIVYDRALFQAREAGWRIGTASKSAGMFEAGDESFWFGFRDDIVVRVRSDENGGSVVDMRSLARQPAHDLGRNAERVGEFLAVLGLDQASE
jgi:hypothetical protein